MLLFSRAQRQYLSGSLSYIRALYLGLYGIDSSFEIEAWQEKEELLLWRKMKMYLEGQNFSIFICIWEIKLFFYWGDFWRYNTFFFFYITKYVVKI